VNLNCVFFFGMFIILLSLIVRAPPIPNELTTKIPEPVKIPGPRQFAETMNPCHERDANA